MKIFYFILLFFSILLNANDNENINSEHTSEHTTQARCAKCTAQSDKTAQVVLTNFASILTNFGTIVADPHNSEKVQQQFCNIAAGIATIAAEAIKSGKINSEKPEDIYNFLITLKLHSKLHEIINKHVPQIRANFVD